MAIYLYTTYNPIVMIPYVRKRELGMMTVGSICGWNDKNEVPCIIHAGDITRLDGIKLLLSDIICGVWPRQVLSVAGKCSRSI